MLKRITDPLPAATKLTILRSQETSKWLQTPPSLSDMEFNDTLHLHPISPLTVIDELQDLAAKALIATNHKSTQVVAQILKSPKECLHLQKNVVTY